MQGITDLWEECDSDPLMPEINLNDIKNKNLFLPHIIHSASLLQRQSILFREVVATCYENHMEHINALCGQNTELLKVNEVVHLDVGVV